jgi:hypothetical protein
MFSWSINYLTLKGGEVVFHLIFKAVHRSNYAEIQSEASFYLKSVFSAEIYSTFVAQISQT